MAKACRAPSTLSVRRPQSPGDLTLDHTRIAWYSTTGWMTLRGVLCYFKICLGLLHFTLPTGTLNLRTELETALCSFSGLWENMWATGSMVGFGVSIMWTSFSSSSTWARLPVLHLRSLTPVESLGRQSGKRNEEGCHFLRSTKFFLLQQKGAVRSCKSQPFICHSISQ